MKKIFEIPELEVVRFVEADIVVCSGCSESYYCLSYGYTSGEICNAVCSWYEIQDGNYYCPAYNPPKDCASYVFEDCPSYGAGGTQSSCASYGYSQPWSDEYGHSGGGWTYEYNDAFGNEEVYQYGSVGCALQ